MLCRTPAEPPAYQTNMTSMQIRGITSAAIGCKSMLQRSRMLMMPVTIDDLERHSTVGPLVAFLDLSDLQTEQLPFLFTSTVKSTTPLILCLQSHCYSQDSSFRSSFSALVPQFLTTTSKAKRSCSTPLEISGVEDSLMWSSISVEMTISELISSSIAA